MKILLMLSLNFILTLQQSVGGGGNGGFGSGGSGFGVKNSTNYYSSSNNEDCQESCWISIVTVLSSCLVFFISFQCYKSGYLRFDCLKIRNQKKQLLQNFISEGNTSTRDELLYGLELLKNSNWNMKYLQREWQSIRLMEKDFKINNNQELNKYYIDVKFRAHDSVGESTYIGHIKQNENEWRIFMIKTYDDRVKSQQLGNQSILIYDGVTLQLPHGFTGRWYFYQASSSHGDWKWQRMDQEEIQL